jgi:hypothetical protein
MQSAGFDAVSPSHATSSAGGESTTRRLIGAVAALTSGALLTVAALLTPSDAGMGTHQQLFSSPCAWITGVDCPCPTCGMTTSFAHAADGNLFASFLAQPLGSLLALATAMTFLLGSFTAATGSRIGHRLTRLWRPRMVWIIAALVIGSWIYKIIWYKGWI